MFEDISTNFYMRDSDPNPHLEEKSEAVPVLEMQYLALFCFHSARRIFNFF